MVPVTRPSGASPVSSPIGILYEHPEWFRLLFAELERRDVPYEALYAMEHRFDPGSPPPSYSLVVNRMSPSAYLRGHGDAIGYTRDLLAYFEEHGVPLVNGPEAFAIECSKARQTLLFEHLGVSYPRTRVVHHLGQIQPAAADLEFPLIVKPNIGGSGALMRRFELSDELSAVLSAGEIELGPDGVGLVQEYHPPKDRVIVRIEVLDGRYLYAIRVPTNPTQGFNLCPADICDVPQNLDLDLCPADGKDRQASSGSSPVGRRAVEAYHPPSDAIRAALAIMSAAKIDIGGVEYLESERDGRRYFYDVNALSNFVADAPRVVGFDPFVTFVDYLVRRARLPAPGSVRAGAISRS